MVKTFQYKDLPIISHLIALILIIRGLLYYGSNYNCPCCGWNLRDFTKGGGSFRRRHFGYCPRCNSKARHRRLWLFLEQKTDLFSGEKKLLHVSPHFSVSRRLIKIPSIEYNSIDIEDRANVTHRMDLTDLSFSSESYDAAICIHVLEHIDNDISAIAELYRVLKSGGWALISVPIKLDQKTYEDPSIETPEAREKAFGEKGHYRFYGHDFKDRLEAAGFRVQLDLGKNIDRNIMKKYGLLDDENIFFCTRI